MWKLIISSGIGGAIAGIFTLLATIVTLKHYRDKEKEKENTEIISLFQALIAEIESLWERYYESIGKVVADVETDNGYFLTNYYQAKENYIVVYDNNVHLIGKINDYELRKNIVKFYVQLRSMVETYHLYNEYLKEYEYYFYSFKTGKDVSQNVKYKQRAEELSKQLSLMTFDLQQLHLNVEYFKNITIPKLNEQIEILSNQQR